MQEIQRDGPLKGIRLLDLTSVVMGPFATQILADLGADVIKVESPSGDTTRNMGPARNKGMGANFIHLNRNKRSVVLDLKTPEGRDACLEIAKTVDVFLFNLRPQAMERLGLSFEAVKEVNPRIVYVGSYGFSNAGPYAGKPAYDDLIQGMTGVASLYSQHTNTPPRYVPLTMADRMVGLHVGIACLAGVIESRSTGEGQFIEIPMFEAMAQCVLSDHFGGETFVPALGEMGYSRLLAEARKPYLAADGYICALIHTDKHWHSFLELTGNLSLLHEGSIFQSIASRGKHVAQVYGFVADVLNSQKVSFWLEKLSLVDIPVAPLNSLEDVLKDPHLLAVSQILQLEHPTEGSIQTVAPLGKYSNSSLGVYRHAPTLGEHTEEVLGELGISLKREN